MTKDKPRYKLKLKSLKFVSAVDRPAQETATAVLLKRGDGFSLVTKFAPVVKVSDELGLVFAWIVTSKSKGEDYYDLQGDNVTDEDLIKVAAEFMQSGGATDQMHDRAKDGQVVFAMPMTPEVAKAFGVETDTFGLMAAVRPSAEVFAKFKSGDYTGFSIDGTGIRTPVEKSTYEPQRPALLTDVDGHTHLIDLAEPGGMTSYETSVGEEHSHSHSWIKTMTGEVVIGASAGHTHEIAATGISAPDPIHPIVPAGEITMTIAAKTAEHLAIEKRASELEAEVSAAKAKAEELQRDLDLQKRAARELNFEEYGYAGGLDGADLARFLKRSSGERTKEIEANVVYKAADGTIYRKGQEQMATLAKRLDEETAARKAADDKAAEVTLTKRAADLMGHLPGDSKTQVALLKAIDGIADEAVRKSSIDAIRAADNAAATWFKTNGLRVAKVDDGSPLVKFQSIVKRIETERAVPYAKAYEMAMDSTEGKAAYAEYTATLG